MRIVGARPDMVVMGRWGRVDWAGVGEGSSLRDCSGWASRGEVSGVCSRLSSEGDALAGMSELCEDEGVVAGGPGARDLSMDRDGGVRSWDSGPSVGNG